MALFPPFSLLPYPLSLSFPSFRLLDLCVYYTMDEGFFSFLIIYLYLLLVCVRLASMIDRSEWMYGLDRVNDPRYLDEVRKFITVAKRHRERLKQIATICACSLSLSICPCIRIRTSSIQLMPRDYLYLQDDGPCKQTMRPWYSLSLSIAC